jgi:nucleoside-diphosphate-sugar epimerase
MRVFVAGATGAIGAPLLRRLVAAGHDVIGLSRTQDGAARLRARGARDVVIADAMDRRALLAAVSGHRADAVIHQLSALKKAQRRTATWRRPTHSALAAATTSSTPPDS